MNININSINYKFYGEKVKGTIVLLHGWGQNIQMMDMLGHPFEKEYQILVVDLPGFGKSPEPREASSVKDYTEAIHELIVKLKIDNPIIVGHSFGGRIAIKYASLYKCKKIVLLSAPFRPSQSSKVSFKNKIYKSVKKVKCLKWLANYLKNKWGSSDYRNASEINRGTLVKVVNEDLTMDAKKIKAPVLLIYGEKDLTVKLEEAKALEKIIKDAGLVVYENLEHYAYLDDLPRTIAILENFFK